MTERSPKDGPWAWVNKLALEKIRKRCEDARLSLSVYLALCEIASDEQSSSFTVSMEAIGAKCCLSRRTVFDRLNDLEAIGLLVIYRSKTSKNFRIPSSYTLLRCESIDQERQQKRQQKRCAQDAQRCAPDVSTECTLFKKGRKEGKAGEGKSSGNGEV